MEEPSHPDETGIHVIIKGDLHDVELFPEFLELSGCAIMEHMEGWIQKERPHYHVWVPYRNPTVKVEENYRKLLRAYYDTKISNLIWKTHANSYYCVKAHNSFTKWLQYVAKDPEVKRGSCIKWNRDGDPPKIEIIANTIVNVGVDTVPTTTKTSKKTSLEKQQKFLRFVQDAFAPEDYNTLTPEILTDYLFEYCANNEFVALNASYTFINYALSHLLDGEARRRYKERYRDVIISKFF